MFHDRMFRDDEVAFVYVYDQPVEADALTLQAEEVSGVTWFDVEMLDRLMHPRDPGICVPQEGFALVKKWIRDQKRDNTIENK